MVDKVVLAAKIAAVRDAVGRVRAVLPGDLETFTADRTTREVVVFNLFVALQECLALATHWLADDGLHVPNSYRDVFLRLGERAVIAPDLAARLAAASGFRNLVAHQYGSLDWRRVYAFADQRAGDLLDFCDDLVILARASE
jgi:uncharacterized protein YutE (UPF0331/DUF86 family)